MASHSMDRTNCGCVVCGDADHLGPQKCRVLQNRFLPDSFWRAQGCAGGAARVQLGFGEKFTAIFATGINSHFDATSSLTERQIELDRPAAASILPRTSRHDAGVSRAFSPTLTTRRLSDRRGPLSSLGDHLRPVGGDLGEIVWVRRSGRRLRAHSRPDAGPSPLPRRNRAELVDPCPGGGGGGTGRRLGAGGGQGPCSISSRAGRRRRRRVPICSIVTACPCPSWRCVTSLARVLVSGPGANAGRRWTTSCRRSPSFAIAAAGWRPLPTR